MRDAQKTHPHVGFQPLQPVTVNGAEHDIQPKQCRRICGVKAKIMIAAVLLLLLLIIFTAAVVMVAVASAGKEKREGATEEGTTEASTSATPVSDRVSCPFKSKMACLTGGCLYSLLNESGEAIPATVPKCFYKTGSTDTSSKSLDLDASDGVSISLAFGDSSSRKKKREASSSTIYTIQNHANFGFAINRNENGETAFNLPNKASLQVMSKFISLTLEVPESSKAYGLGDFGKLVKMFDDTAYTIWTRTEEEGAHPFILLISESGCASGLYVDSTYPMDITLQRGPKINIVILSSSLKIKLFLGPTTADVIKQYWDVVGSPTRPPFWGLGHFYGSESTNSYSALSALLLNNTKLSLPVEGILLPSALNQDSQPFSYSQQIQTEVAKHFSKNTTRFIVTVPPAVVSITGNTTWFMASAGVDQKVFLYSNENKTAYIEGMLSNKMAKYPDFTASNIDSFWSANITDYDEGYGFHLHKNTPYSQINGSVGICTDLDSDINLATDILNLRNLEENSLCLSAYGKKGKQVELHNKFAWQQAKITQSSLTPWSVSKQPLIISDSTSPGIGRFAGHFHDSSKNTYTGLKTALNELVTMSFLGVPITGPNICTKEFISQVQCTKWYYLSVVSPLAWSVAKDLPHLFAGNTTFLDTVDTILQFRQQLLHYHYDSLYRANTAHTVPLRFLSFDYPKEQKAQHFEDEVLLGNAILYSPILRPDEEYRVSYLPPGLWCSWVDGSCYKGPTEVKVLAENAPASFTFLKGGTAVVTQNSAETTTQARTKKMRLIVVLDEDGKANSTRFFDDGETANTLSSKYYTLINYSVANNTLIVTLPQAGYQGGVMKMKYEKIFVYGLTAGDAKIFKRDGETTVRGSNLMAGDTDYHKIIISDTSVEIGLSEAFTLSWAA